MKNYILLLAMVLFYSCSQETVPSEKPTETVTLAKVDTVHVHDTVTIVRDTVIVEHRTDTVFITMYFVHPYYIHLVDRFYQEGERYGWTLPKNNLIVVQWFITDIQENGYPDWYEGDGIAISYQDNTQWYVQMNE